MKKIMGSLLLFLAIFNLCVLDVSADNIDSSRISSVTINHQYNDIVISDAEVSLYFLANIDANGQFHFDDNYLDVSFDFSNMTTSEVSLKAKEILSYIAKKEIHSDFSLKTKEDGSGYFSNLVPGLYLVSIDSKVIDDYRYEVSPMIITIPTLENDTYQYDVLVNTKTKREKIEQEVTPPSIDDNGEKVPNTLDNIYLYVILFIISFLVIVGVMIYILKRKGENKNENKE